MRLFNYLSLALITLTLLGLSSCTQDPTAPQVGSGTELKAKVAGREFTFPLNLVAPAAYDPATMNANFSGVITGDTSRTIRVSFIYDIDKGPFPATLSKPDVSIVYVETVAGNSLTYNCPVGVTGCSVTLTGSNGTIADGTFNATLARFDDSTKTVAITGGTFSVKLTR
jgi:hypothetical protein